MHPETLALTTLYGKVKELEKSLEEAKEKISQSIAVAVEDTKTEEISQEKHRYRYWRIQRDW